MGQWRKFGAIGLLSLDVFMGLLAFSQGRVQGKGVVPHRYRAFNSMGQSTDNMEVVCKGVAHHLSLERYRFVKRLGQKLGFFPLYFYQSSSASCTLLFPVRRSDRVYMLLQGVGPNVLLCYQHRDKSDTLVYRVNLKASPTKPYSRIKNILNYLNSYPFEVFVDNNGHDINESYAVIGKIDTYTQRDLTINRDYVQYNYNPYIDSIRVTVLSDVEKDGIQLKDYLFYDLERNPVTGEKLKPGEFYAEFGLPEAKKEYRYYLPSD